MNLYDNQSTSNTEINHQLHNFIHLLRNSTQNLHKSLKSTGKLSVILSASQPESSTADKQNSHLCSNRSGDYSQFDTILKPEIPTILYQLLKSGLTKAQQQLLTLISLHIQELISTLTCQSQKIATLQTQLSKQKQGTDSILQALIKLDQQSKQLQSSYTSLSAQYNQKCLQFVTLQSSSARLNDQIIRQRKEAEWLKNLIYKANENYEQLADRLYPSNSAQTLRQREPSDIRSQEKYSKYDRHAASHGQFIKVSPDGSRSRAGSTSKTIASRKAKQSADLACFRQIYRQIIDNGLKNDKVKKRQKRSKE